MAELGLCVNEVFHCILSRLSHWLTIWTLASQAIRLYSIYASKGFESDRNHFCIYKHRFNWYHAESTLITNFMLMSVSLKPLFSIWNAVVFYLAVLIKLSYYYIITRLWKALSFEWLTLFLECEDSSHLGLTSYFFTQCNALLSWDRSAIQILHYFSLQTGS